MSTQYIRLPVTGVPVYSSFSAFPVSAPNGTLAIDGSTDILYIYSTGAMAWEAIGGTSVPLGVGVYDSQTPDAKGLVIANNLIYAQSATATVPGMVNTGAQSLAGVKTLTSAPILSSLTASTGLQLDSGKSVISATLGTVTETTSSVLTLTGFSNATFGSPTIQVKQSSTSQSGYLSNTDWNTFNGKQAAGNYITALTGDGTASGPGSAILTLATVNSNVGNFGDASNSASFNVNAKGLITAASSVAIQIAESQVTNLVSDLAGKQPVGNYITALTGDVAASGPGSAAATLATVNGNVGSFTYSSITVNGKGLITAASSGAAPVTTLAAVGAVPNNNAASISGNTLNLQPFDSTHPGVVPASGGGTTNFLRADGTFAAPTASAAIQVAVVLDQQTQNTGGGTPSGTGTWLTRNLTTVQTSQSWLSLGSNQLTLSAGTYLIQASAPAYNTLSHQTRLQNITDVTTALLGSTEYAGAATVETRSFIYGVIAPAGSKVYEIQHIVGNNAGASFGIAGNFTSEAYTAITITKLA